MDAAPPPVRPVSPVARRSALALRVALILLFGWLVARHWHPYYGFTRLLQCDQDTASKIAPTLRGAPIYVHREPGSYDGFYYAEIATDPTLRAPGLAASVDDLGYRGRRILLSAAAWALGGGEAAAAARAYAWLNLFVWLALAAVLWRIFPCDGWRATLGWSGVLFATGAALSVRFALTDLAALLFIALALSALERGRSPWVAACWLSLAGLARETALLAAGAFLPRGRPARWFMVFAALALSALPLLLWLAYVRATLGSSGPGLGNFAWPLTAALRKGLALVEACRHEPNRWLVAGSVGAFIALFVQLLYLARRPAPADPWWRLGAAFAVLLLCLGPSVWGEDLPGAAVRVLLPLTLAFNVLAVRRRAAVLWLVLGNLSLLGAAAAIVPLSQDEHEFVTARFGGGTYIVHTSAAFHPTESRRRAVWAWSRGASSVQVDFWPRPATAPKLAVKLSATAPRDLAILHAGQVLWRGPIGREPRWIELGALPAPAGAIELSFQTDAPPEREAASAGGRELAFSLGGVRVE